MFKKRLSFASTSFDCKLFRGGHLGIEGSILQALYVDLVSIIHIGFLENHGSCFSLGSNVLVSFGIIRANAVFQRVGAYDVTYRRDSICAFTLQR